MPVGFRIASAWVDIRAEDKGLKQQIKTAVEKAAKGNDAKIPLNIDSKGLRREVSDALKEATSKQKPKVAIGISSKGLRAEVTKALKAATEKQKPKVKLGINATGLKGEVQRALTAATKGQKPTVKLGISSVGLRGEVQRALNEATAGQSGTVTINARVDGDRLQRALADADPTITPHVDHRALRQSLMSAIRRINVNDDVTINANIDGDLLARQIQSEIGRLRDRFRVRIHPDVDVDTFAARLQAAARSVPSDIDIDLNPRINQLKLRAEAGRAFAALRGKIQFDGELKTAMLAAQVKAAQAALNRMGRDLTFRAKVDVDTAAARAKIAAMNAMLRDHGGHWTRWAQIAVAAALAVGPALSVVDRALRSTGASLAVLVPMVTGLSAMLATFFVGMSGVAATISGVFETSKTAINQLGDNFERLSPEAKKFIQALQGVKTGFTQLRIDVQDQLFKGMDKTLENFTHASMPALRRGLAETAMNMNAMAKGATDVVNRASRMGELDAMFQGINVAFGQLIPLPGQFLNGLIKTSIAATPLLTRMNSAFANWARNMTDRLNQAFTDGTLQRAISSAGDTIVNFFRRIANNPEWNTFVSRMKENGPRMAEAFAHISEALLKILNALSPITGVIMTVVDAFARMINAMPIEVLTLIITKLVLFKTALLIGTFVVSLTDKIILLRRAMVTLGSQAAMVDAIRGRLTALGLTAPAINRVATAMRAVGRAIMGALLITTLVWAFEAIGNKAKGAAPDVEKLSTSLKELAVSGKFTGELKKNFGSNIDDVVEKLHTLHEKMAEHKKDLSEGNFGPDTPLDDFGQWISDGIKKMSEGHDSLWALKDDFKSFDKALADMANNGYSTQAAEDFAKLKKAWLEAGYPLDELIKSFPEYKDALGGLKTAQKLAAEGMGAYGAQAVVIQGQLDAQRRAADGLKQSIEALNDAHRQAAGGEIAMESALDSATGTIETNMKALKDSSMGLDVHTEKGRQNRQALLQLAQTTSDYAQAKLQETGSYTEANKIYERGREQFVKLAMAAGATREEAKKLAEQWLKMPDKKIALDADVDSLDRKIADAQAEIDKLKQKRKVAVGADKKDLDDKITKAQAELDLLEARKNEVLIEATIDDLNTKIDKAQQTVDDLKQKRKTAVGADKKDLDDKIKKAQEALDALKQKKKAAIKVKDETKQTIDNIQSRLDGIKDKTVTVTVIGNNVYKYKEGANIPGYGGNIPSHATGGLIRGPGSGTSDSIMARLSNGEYVMTAATVEKYGVGFMKALNNGTLKLPKFAAGGPVTGGGGTSGASGVKAGETTGTFTVKDGTGKPVASAVNNFKALKIALSQTYQDMATKTTLFGNQFQAKSDVTYKAVQSAGTEFGRKQVNDLNATRNKSQNIWSSWKSGMQNRTTATYKTLQTQGSAFQKNHTATASKASSSTQSIWTGWRTGMTTRTNDTYKKINSATSSFSKQSTTKIGQARDGMGAAWGGLSPKFKPPVSYLVHTVINKGVVGSMNAIMQKLGGGKSVGGISVPGFATGGPIYGAGSKTSDSIPARLSNGEYVIQAKAVDKFGVGFFNQLNRGSMPGQGAGYKPGFATGGPVNIRMAGFASGGLAGVPSADTLNKIMGEGGDADVKKMTDFIMNNYVLPLIDSGPGGSAMKDVQRAGMNHIRSNVEKFVKDNFGGAGSAAAGLRWAKTQYGKPYQWGGNGNPSWDCSGFMSAIESVIRGEKPHRRWSTHAFSGATAPSGWRLGAKAPFQIGITNAGVGHTAGTIGKENVESSGGIGVHGGVGVPRGAHDGLFSAVYGYVGPNATKKARGGYISGPGGPRDDKVAAWLSNGEFVMRAAAVKRLGTGYLNALNSGQIPGFASGGSTSSTTYKVKSGDTLSEIAQKFHTTVSALMALNKNIKDANKIYAGQTLVIKKAISKGSSGSSSSGKVATAPKGDIQDAGAKTSLQNLVTLRESQVIANSKAGAKYMNEAMTNITAQSDMDTLVSNLTQFKSAILDAFKGKTQDVLAAKFTSTANKLIPLQSKLDGVTKKLGEAQEKLDDLKQKFDSLKDSVSGAVLDFGKITKVGTYGTSGSTLLAQLQKDTGKATEFANMLEQLKAKGVSGDLIGQIAEAGVTGGGMATAQTVLNMTPEQLKQLNSLQAELTKQANKAGEAAATGMYGAGVAAAEGLVKGLEAQQKAIEAQMKVIADAMVQAIRQALGIKSPSTVMMQVADFTADGLVNQLIARKDEVDQTMRSLVTVPTAGINAPATGAGTIGGGSSVTQVTRIENLHVHVNGTFELNTPASRKTLAKTIVKEMKEEIRLDDKKRK